MADGERPEPGVNPASADPGDAESPAAVAGVKPATATGVGPAATAGAAASVAAAPPGRRRTRARDGFGTPSWIALAFLLPALLLLGFLVLYPIIYTIGRSFFDAAGKSFVGFGNYTEMFRADATRTAIKNNVLWVLVLPVVVTALGLVFAVLAERVRWATAFKLVVFFPVAISFLAAGIIFRLVYEANPDRGILNAAIVGVHDIFKPSAAYPGARPRDTQLLAPESGGGLQTSRPFSTGDTALLGLVGIKPENLPPSAKDAVAPTGTGDAIAGTVWFDFKRGGGGTPNQVDPGEKGLPGVRVEAVGSDGSVAAKATSDDAGRFTLSGLSQGSYTLRLPKGNFTAPFSGPVWLGPTLATWAIMGAYVWMWAGFAMVLIAAGLSAIPRDALEAARVDGATEWQVFRRVTIPLLSPVLLVVIVTLTINVLKVFDLVLVLPPQSSQDDATVLALEMWRSSFGGGNNFGLGSAIGVFLFLLVLPAMVFNIRRFRRDQM